MSCNGFIKIIPQVSPVRIKHAFNLLCCDHLKGFEYKFVELLFVHLAVSFKTQHLTEIPLRQTPKGFYSHEGYNRKK